MIASPRDQKEQGNDIQPPDLTVVIPAYNRSEIIGKTLDSVLQSEGAISIEIIVVDDGSDIPLQQALIDRYLNICRIIRQHNQGLLFARLTGLREAQGRYVLFLDSDDYVSADKLASHVHSMDNQSLDVSYTNTASAMLYETGAVGELDHLNDLPNTRDHSYFFVRIQPAPHSPAFRRTYLNSALQQAPFQPSPKYNPIAEIYFYLVCSLVPANVGKCLGLAITGIHPGVRITNNWEPMGLGSLSMMEAFVHSAPNTSAGLISKRYIAEAAFFAWRKLPYDYPVSVRKRYRSIAKYASHKQLRETGGNFFQFISKLLGPFTSAAVLRRLRGKPYKAVGGMTYLDLQALIEKLN